ncbi:Bromodomain-containing protein [Russula earlei]|uniref:Bromodomain-containing protein n=1 Tax=Russula earlei TaxID=71964 RepID=A0ACC0UMA8_9AGAM|nr:Bromodomain-containing protein [Russula earlei]
MPDATTTATIKPASATAPTTDGLHYDPNTDPDSPLADSPDTPINNVSDVAVKITSDIPEVESDVRHEPYQISLSKLDDASIRPQIDTPIDPLSISSLGTLPPSAVHPLPDIFMAEENPQSQNGNPTQEDVEMGDAEPLKSSTEADDPPLTRSPTGTPGSAVGGSSITAVDSVHVRDVSPNEDDAPPAKRARKFSDADQASAHQTAAHTSPAPDQVSAAATHVNGELPPSTFSLSQYKFALSTIRTLKKLKDATPFRFPVDPEALKIPHYLQIIKHPMDFSTIEHKLLASSPVKPDLNAANPRYISADEFIADVRLIFSNCVTFNGPEHVVTQQGKRVEAVFDKQIKQLPPPEEPKPVIVKKPATPPPPPPPPPPVPKKAPRRPSTSVPVIRRNETENAGRPKREIHPPPPKDLPYADAPKKHRRRSVKKDASNEQLRHCVKILDQLGRKQHATVVGPFSEPVDWAKLAIPDYPKIVKKPMDLGTMRNKLDSGAYATAEKFRDDFKLIISNCFLYNPPGTVVHQAGVELKKLFEEKWKGLPPLRAESEDEEDEDDTDSDEERTRALTIAAMESQIETMRNSISALKNQKEKKTKKSKKKDASASISATTSKAVKKETKVPKKKSAPKKTQIPDDDVLSFEQKKDLSEAIQTLDGQKLERVIQIIHEGVPEIRDSQEEIELEIDTAPCICPDQVPPVKRNRTGKGTGTGGLKRKSMDEDLEAEKIRKLEDRMKLFEKTANGDAVTPGTHAAHIRDSEHSSESSSDDDSSGSESE